MLPTYILPYFGSNSSVLHAVDASVGTRQFNQAFWLHFGFMLILCFLCWIRGLYVNRKWLILFPSLAAFFDFTPGFSIIPMFPTFMHLAAIISGVVGARKSQESEVLTSSGGASLAENLPPAGALVDVNVNPVSGPVPKPAVEPFQPSPVVSPRICRCCGMPADPVDSYCTECGKLLG